MNQFHNIKITDVLTTDEFSKSLKMYETYIMQGYSKERAMGMAIIEIFINLGFDSQDCFNLEKWNWIENF